MSEEVTKPIDKINAGPDYLNAADILSCDDTQYVDIEIPEWRGTVKLRSMTAAEAVEFVNKAKESGNVESTAVMLWVALRCLVNGNGDRLFSDRALQQLQDRNVAPFLRIQKRALDLNGFTDKGGGIVAVKNA